MVDKTKAENQRMESANLSVETMHLCYFFKERQLQASDLRSAHCNW